MSNTHNTCLSIAAVVVMFSFAADAQTVSVETPALQTPALQGEATPAVPPPLSIMQRYVPAGAPVRPDAPLQLLIDDSQTPQLSAPLALTAHVGSDEVGTQPAINSLGPGRFALTVSHVSRAGR
jgi:hypothetical protein